jgi:SHS2 domain-containing protein
MATMRRHEPEDCMPKRFEEVDHTADCAIRVHGRTLEQLLQNAACGLNAMMGAVSPAAGGPVRKEIDIDALDAESLLVAWLSDLAFWAESEMLVFNRFEFRSVSDSKLRAAVTGNRAARIERHVKAVTFHNLRIEQSDEGLSATVVFDV